MNVALDLSLWLIGLEAASFQSLNNAERFRVDALAGFSIFGLQNISLRDVFWVGASYEAKYSCLSGIQFLIVDRRQKRPRASLSSPIWAQPVYVLQRRGGGYLWGFCRLENSVLSLCSVAQRAKLLRLRNGVDAEVVGRVVGVIRKLM